MSSAESSFDASNPGLEPAFFFLSSTMQDLRLETPVFNQSLNLSNTLCLLIHLIYRRLIGLPLWRTGREEFSHLNSDTAPTGQKCRSLCVYMTICIPVCMYVLMSVGIYLYAQLTMVWKRDGLLHTRSTWGSVSRSIRCPYVSKNIQVHVYIYKNHIHNTHTYVFVKS